MANDYKVLYRGQLPSSVTTLYTVPASTQTIIRYISVQEATGAGGPYTFDLYVNGTTAAYHWKGMSLDNDESADWDGTLTLDTGETIAGVAGTASKLTVFIFGNEVT